MATTSLALPAIFNQTTIGQGTALSPTTSLSSLPQWNQLLGLATQDLYQTEGLVTSDTYAARGSQAAQQGYQVAAGLAGQNAGYEEQSVALQLAQSKRAEYQTIGAETAGISASGLQQSGSAMNLLRSSVQQANLTNQTIQLQGQINENAYQQQQQAFMTEATVAGEAAQGQTAAAGIAQAGGTAAMDLLTKQAQGIVTANPAKQLPVLGGVG